MYGTKKDSAHVLCERENLATLRYSCLDSYILDREDVGRNSGSLLKGQGSIDFILSLSGTKDPSKIYVHWSR